MKSSDNSNEFVIEYMESLEKEVIELKQEKTELLKTSPSANLSLKVGSLNDKNVLLEEENENLKAALQFARDKFKGTVHMEWYNPQVMRQYDEEIKKYLSGEKK